MLLLNSRMTNYPSYRQLRCLEMGKSGFGMERLATWLDSSYEIPNPKTIKSLVEEVYGEDGRFDIIGSLIVSIAFPFHFEQEACRRRGDKVKYFYS